jgi:hypothetical protein
MPRKSGRLIGRMYQAQGPWSMYPPIHKHNIECGPLGGGVQISLRTHCFNAPFMLPDLTKLVLENWTLRHKERDEKEGQA